MKLDSEQQRKELLELLAQVPLQVTIGNVEEQARAVTKLLDPIRNAELEEPENSRLES